MCVRARWKTAPARNSLNKSLTSAQLTFYIKVHYTLNRCHVLVVVVVFRISILSYLPFLLAGDSNVARTCRRQELYFRNIFILFLQHFGRNKQQKKQNQNQRKCLRLLQINEAKAKSWRLRCRSGRLAMIVIILSVQHTQDRKPLGSGKLLCSVTSKAQQVCFKTTQIRSSKACTLSVEQDAYVLSSHQFNVFSVRFKLLFSDKSLTTRTSNRCAHD